MVEPTINVNVVVLADLAKKAITNMNFLADKEWNRIVDETYIDYLGAMGLYYKKRSRTDIAMFLGKPDKYVKSNSEHFKIFSKLKRYIDMYNDFIVASKSIPNYKVNLSLASYNLLLAGGVKFNVL